jgi:hypothetical protein
LGGSNNQPRENPAVEGAEHHEHGIGTLVSSDCDVALPQWMPLPHDKWLARSAIAPPPVSD